MSYGIIEYVAYVISTPSHPCEGIPFQNLTFMQAADSSSDEAQSSRRRKKKVASKDKKVVDVHPNESAEDGQNPAAAWNSPHMARSENMAHDQPSVPRRYRLPTEGEL